MVTTQHMHHHKFAYQTFHAREFSNDKIQKNNTSFQPQFSDPNFDTNF